MVLVAMWGTVLVLIAGYIWFVVWRLRVERRKKEREAASSPSMPTPMPEVAPSPGPSPTPGPVAAAPFVAASTMPAAPAPSAGPRTLIELLEGIQLPYDLAPITMMAPRPDVRERIAFETDTAPGQTVGAAFGAELERLGYTLTPMDATLVEADRGTDHLRCKIHIDAATAEIGKNKAFPAVPADAVVIEVWVPY